MTVILLVFLQIIFYTRLVSQKSHVMTIIPCMKSKLLRKLSPVLMFQRRFKHPNLVYLHCSLFLTVRQASHLAVDKVQAATP